jgi:hypothetical protein
MSLTAKCTCGKVYVLEDDAAGRSFRCQACGRSVDVAGANFEDAGSTRVDAPAIAPGADPGFTADRPARAPTTLAAYAEPPHTTPAKSGPARVVVVDFDMAFGSMVWFMVKLAVASIPATLILAVIVILFQVVFGLLFVGLRQAAQ